MAHLFLLLRRHASNSVFKFLHNPHLRKYSTPIDEFVNQETKFKQMIGLNERQKKIREKFFESEKEYDSKIHWANLTEEEIEIVRAHKKAVVEGHFTYEGGQGKRVMTRLRHFLRGSCCGSACRHCIYNHDNIPEDMRGTKKFNSAFWVDANPTNFQKDDGERYK